MDKSLVAATTAIKVSNHIYDDVAFIILSKLPLKSLFRFSCARKSWSVLFQNSYFMDMFRTNFISMDHSYYNDTSIILDHIAPFDDDSILDWSYVLYSLFGERFENTVKIDWPNPYQVPYKFCIHGSASVNGIFCIEDCGRVGQHEDIEGGRIVLWNPATHEYKVIPISSFAYKSPRWKPYIEFHGFGYDQVTDDYKVIRHITFFEDHNLPYDESRQPDSLWEIYCLKSNCWRKLDLDMPTQDVGGVGVQVYTDGVCHWWRAYKSEIGGEVYLVSFDLNNETFVKTSMPSNMDHIGFVFRHLGMLNGSICWISSYGDHTCTFHISILGQVGIKESWIKLLIVGPLPCVLHPIGIGKKGDIFFWRMDYELVWFNLNTQKIEELGVKGEELCRIIIYKKSYLPF